MPYLRGYGTTRFLSQDAPRNAQQSALGADVISLMDALGIAKATIAGCDWGARTVNIVAALWPERCKAMVSVSGYLIGNEQLGMMPLPPKAELQWWYQYYFPPSASRRYEKYTPTSKLSGNLLPPIAFPQSPPTEPTPSTTRTPHHQEKTPCRRLTPKKLTPPQARHNNQQPPKPPTNVKTPSCCFSRR